MNGWKQQLPGEWLQALPQERQQQLLLQGSSALPLARPQIPPWCQQRLAQQRGGQGLLVPWERLSQLLQEKTQAPNLSLSEGFLCTFATGQRGTGGEENLCAVS